MDQKELDFVHGQLGASLDVMTAACENAALHHSMIEIADVMVTSLRRGGKILFAGNGGSAGDAQHIAGEFVSRLNFDRAPLAGLALTTDTSVLTAIGNDYGYDKVFERQVLGLGNDGDVFVGITTSGRSTNILNAFTAARSKGLTTVCMTGMDPRMAGELSDYHLCVPSDCTPYIQQIHIVVAHVICGLVENAMFKSVQT